MTFEERLDIIDSRKPEVPSESDLQAIVEAETEGFGSAKPLDEFMQELEGISGRFVIRLPRTLHKRLKEEASAEGVSLNQYVLYKLAQ